MATQKVLHVKIPALNIQVTGVPAGGQGSESIQSIPVDAEACLGVTGGPVRRVGTEPVVVKMLDATKGLFQVPACTWQLRSEIESKQDFAPMQTMLSLQLMMPTAAEQENPRYAQRVVTVHVPVQKVLLGAPITINTVHSEDDLEFQWTINTVNTATSDNNTTAFLKFETDLARTAGHATLDTLENAVKVATEERLARTEAVQAAGNALMGYTAKQAGDTGLVSWNLETCRAVGIDMHSDVAQVNALNAAATLETLPTQLWLCVVAQTGLLAEVAQKADVPLVNGSLSPTLTAAAVRTWLRKTKDEVQIDRLTHYLQTLAVMGSTYVNDPALETGACVQSCSVNADGTVNLTLTKGCVKIAKTAGEDQTWIGPDGCRAIMTAALNNKLSLEAMDCEDSAQRIMSGVHALSIPSDAMLNSTLEQVIPHLPTHVQAHIESLRMLTFGLSAALKRTGEKSGVSDACGCQGSDTLKHTGVDASVQSCTDAGSALRAAVERSLAKGTVGLKTYRTHYMNAILAAAPQIGAMQTGKCASGPLSEPDMTPNQFLANWQGDLLNKELSGHAVAARGKYANLAKVCVDTTKGERVVTLKRKVNDFEPKEGTALADKLSGPNNTSLFSMNAEALSVPATGAINAAAVAQRTQLQKLATVLRGQHISKAMGVNVGSAIMASEIKQKMLEQGLVADVTAQQRFATGADPTTSSKEELGLMCQSCFYKMGFCDGENCMLTVGKNANGKTEIVSGALIQRKLNKSGTFALSTEMQPKEKDAIGKIASVTASHCARLGHLQNILPPVAPLEYQLARDAQGRVLSSAELGPTDSGVAIKALPLFRTREELNQARDLVQEAVKGLKTTGIQIKHAILANAMTVAAAA